MFRCKLGVYKADQIHLRFWCAAEMSVWIQYLSFYNERIWSKRRQLLKRTLIPRRRTPSVVSQTWKLELHHAVVPKLIKTICDFFILRKKMRVLKADVFCSMSQMFSEGFTISFIPVVWTFLRNKTWKTDQQRNDCEEQSMKRRLRVRFWRSWSCSQLTAESGPFGLRVRFD